MEPLGRMTPAVADVLEVLLDADNPVWGLKVVKETARPSGSIYPILGRLERLGWTTSQWDDDEDRTGPRRRLYLLTDGARASARAAVSEVRERQAKLSTQTRQAPA